MAISANRRFPDKFERERIDSVTGGCRCDAELATAITAACHHRQDASGSSPREARRPSNSNQFGMNGAPSIKIRRVRWPETRLQNNGQNCDSPASVQQSFENIKSNLQTQFNQLIQGTSDAGQVASLTSQEQRLLTNLNTQEQHDMAAASQGCVQVTQAGKYPVFGRKSECWCCECWWRGRWRQCGRGRWHECGKSERRRRCCECWWRGRCRQCECGRWHECRKSERWRCCECWN